MKDCKALAPQLYTRYANNSRKGVAICSSELIDCKTTLFWSESVCLFNSLITSHLHQRWEEYDSERCGHAQEHHHPQILSTEHPTVYSLSHGGQEHIIQKRTQNGLCNFCRQCMKRQDHPLWWSGIIMRSASFWWVRNTVPLHFYRAFLSSKCVGDMDWFWKMEISGRKKVRDQMKLATLEIGPSTQVRPAKKYTQATSVIQDSGSSWSPWVPLLWAELDRPWKSSNKSIFFVVVFSEQSVSSWKVKFVGPEMKTLNSCFPLHALPANSF